MSVHDSLILVGAASIAVGVVVREWREDARGLGMSLIVVGGLMIACGPIGRALGLW
jgi:hypothetical protein